MFSRPRALFTFLSLLVATPSGAQSASALFEASIDDVQRAIVAGEVTARELVEQALARIEAAYLEHRDPVTLGKRLSELLRRGMLAYAPRDQVAGLTGEEWLRWLDRGMPVPYFSTGWDKWIIMVMPPGAFFMLAIAVWVFRTIQPPEEEAGK